MKKEKIVISLAAGAAILTLGATAALAATNHKGTMAKIDVQTEKTTFSTDGGMTWQDDAPQGLKTESTTDDPQKLLYTYNADGSLEVKNEAEVEIPKNAVMARINSETNEVDYSQDGGQTWTKDVPANLMK